MTRSTSSQSGWSYGESEIRHSSEIPCRFEAEPWAKAIKKSTPQSDLSDRRLMQLEFWTKFQEYASSHGSTLRLRKAYPQHWYDISIGNSKSHLSLVVDTNNEQIRCQFYIPDSKALFNALLEKKESIESKLPHELKWMELDGKKACRVRTIHKVDVADNANWEASFQWLIDTAQQFHAVFADQLKKMKI